MLRSNCLLFCFLLLFFTLTCKGLPTTYDQRQDGKLNVDVQLDNFAFVLATSVLKDIFIDKITLDAVSFKNEPWQPNELQQDHATDTSTAVNESTVKAKEEENKGVKTSSMQKMDELKLIGDGIENCGPARHRDKWGLCQPNETSDLA